ncbi:hypothetical protein [Streptomyces sp. CB01881]|uniref:hypothetical protein n=1 Tax=Streptomyces sp. CB01881 TaxID=2078691 RepID=UPI000CDC9EC3|nr:hypothetical protein [Streptomyces sp. CB01881]AUY53969.1 hypothetical protein C2142_05110 [Streptomyces sp. CB01881]TYC77831.1 hypothetical protein EH183_05125 [Streptomyces sp. CB01881]
MDILMFNVTTAALMVLMFNGGLALVGRGTLGRRRIPWAGVGLTGLALAGVAVQLGWSGAMGALDADPSKSGWWRVVTSVFMQNGGFGGAAWNIATLAAVAALADWFWGAPLTLGLFAAGILLPERIDALWGQTSHSTDPRNFAGSSGATYFLGATLAAALLLHGGTGERAGQGAGQGADDESVRRRAVRNNRLLALGVPVLGLAMWFAQENGHGLVSAYGFALGALAWAAFRTVLRPDRDLVQPPRTTVGSLTGLVGRRARSAG